jgi:hypothetical protein
MIKKILLRIFLLFLSYSSYAQNNVTINGEPIGDVGYYGMYDVDVAGTDMTPWLVTPHGDITYQDNYTASIDWLSEGIATVTYENQDAYGYYYGELDVTIYGPEPPDPNATVEQVTYNCGNTTVERSYLSPYESYEWYWQTSQTGTSTTINGQPGNTATVTINAPTTLYLRARDKDSYTWSTNSQNIGFYDVYSSAPSTPSSVTKKVIGSQAGDTIHIISKQNPGVSMV